MEIASTSFAMAFFMESSISMMSRFSFLVITALICIAGIPSAASPNAIGDADRDLFQYIHENMKNGALDAAMPAVQLMGDPRVCLAFCAVLSAFGDEKMAETGALATVAVIETGSVVYALKYMVGRPRPLSESDKDSFPSGHTALAFSLATVVGHQYTKLRIPLYVAAFGTGFARIYLGKHYPSDVVAGAFMGALAGFQAIYFRDRILSFSF